MPDSPPRPRLTLRTLGGLTLHRDGVPEPLLSGVKPLAVPAVLATLPGYSADRRYVAELIWGAESFKRARGSLRQAIHHLHRFGEGGGVRSDEERVWLDLDRIRIDLIEFEEAIRARDFDDALPWYGGGFLKPIEGKVSRELRRSIDAHNDRIQIALDIAYPRLVESRLEDGAYSEAIRFAQRYASDNAFSDKAQLTLIRALQTAGMDTEALQVYEGYRSLLESELGGDLSDEAVDSLQRLLDVLTDPPEPTRLVFVSEPARERDLAPPVPVPPRRRTLPPPAWISLGVALTAGVWLGADALQPADPWPSGAVVALPFQTADSRDARFTLEVTSDGQTVTSRASEVRQDIVLSASGRSAYSTEGPLGVDLLVDLADGRGPRALKSEPADENALDWSPDERRLLFRSRRLDADAGYVTEVRTIGVAGDRERVLLRLPGDPGVLGRWSPDGERIALLVGQPLVGPDSLLILDAGGELIHALLASPGTLPSWSPIGDRIAFVAPGAQGGWSRLRTTDREGEGTVTVLAVPGTLTTPVHLTQNLLAFVADVGLGSDVWVTDLRSNELGRLTDRGDVSGIGVGLHPPSDLGWLDDVPLESLSTVTSFAGAGEAISSLTLNTSVVPVVDEVFHVDAVSDRAGALNAHVRAASLEWVLPPGVEQVGPNAFVVRLPGPVELRASLHGWVESALRLDVAEGDRTRIERPLLFSEDWTDVETALHRWRLVGDPLPLIDPDGGRAGGAFLNNGDQNYSSGALTQRRFPISGGLTLEVEARVPFTGGIFQDFVLGFGDPVLTSDSAAARTNVAVGTVLHLDPRRGLRVMVDGEYSGAALPNPDGLDSWRTYTLQIDASGGMSVWVDGRLYFRPAEPVGITAGDSVRVILGGNSLGTTLRHGRVWVWEGAVWSVAG